MKKKRSRLFAILIIVFAAAVVGFSLLVRGGGSDTASVSLPSAAPESARPGAAGETDSPVRAEVTAGTVQAVVARLSRAESYSRTVTIETFWNGGSGSETLSQWVDGGSTLIRRDSDGRNVLVSADGALYIWYAGSDGCYRGEAGDGSADRWLRSLTYEELLSLPADAVTGAGYGDYGGVPCVWAEYVSGSLDYRSTVYISVDTGLLMGAETRDGDTLIYRMTSGAPDISAPDESLFLPPAASTAAP